MGYGHAPGRDSLSELLLSRRAHQLAITRPAGAGGLSVWRQPFAWLFARLVSEPALVGELQRDRTANVLADADPLHRRGFSRQLQLVLRHADVQLAQRHPRQLRTSATFLMSYSAHDTVRAIPRATLPGGQI